MVPYEKLLSMGEMGEKMGLKSEISSLITGHCEPDITVI
jgi:hypothetical protein